MKVERGAGCVRGCSSVQGMNNMCVCDFVQTCMCEAGLVLWEESMESIRSGADSVFLHKVLTSPVESLKVKKGELFSSFACNVSSACVYSSRRYVQDVFMSTVVSRWNEEEPALTLKTAKAHWVTWPYHGSRHSAAFSPLGLKKICFVSAVRQASIFVLTPNNSLPSIMHPRSRLYLMFSITSCNLFFYVFLSFYFCPFLSVHQKESAKKMHL